MPYLSKAFTLGIIVGISGLIISLSPPGLRLEENFGLHLLFELRESRQAPAEVVIVAIDKASADKLNVDDQPRKWPRSLHARLTDNLVNRGASVIVFDLFFNEPRSTDDDLLFAEAIESAGTVVLGEYLEQEVFIDDSGQVIDTLHAEKHILPIPDLAQPAAAVASFPLPKYPHRVNQFWTFKTAAGNLPTLPAAAFQVFASDSYEDLIRLIDNVSPLQADRLPRSIQFRGGADNTVQIMKMIREQFEKEPSLAEKILKKISGPKVPHEYSEKFRTITSLVKMYTSPDTQYLNFYGPPRTINTIPYYQVLQLNETLSGNQSEIDFSGKAVFVGLSEIMESEKRDDTFHTVFSQPNGVDISGVEIAATAFANILEDMPLHPLNPYKHLAIILAWGLFLGIVFDRLIPSVISVKEMVLPIGAIAASIIAYLMFTQYQFKTNAVWYPVVIPLIQVPLAFFGSLAMRNIYRERTGYGIYLFTDISGFTKLSENLDPGYLKELMHRYFSPLTKVVEQQGGIMETVPGDAMLARWEVKTSGDASAKQRKQACLAALDIAREIKKVIQSSHQQLHTRIGLHSGRTSRGNIGSRHQRKNITFGDTVNTAQRVEELNKYLGTQILLSEEVLNQLDGFLTREVGKFVLAGKSQPIVLHELMCPLKEAAPGQIDLCALFSDALHAFERQSWEVASGKFNEIINKFGQDGPSRYYLSLCESYREKPPEESWKGVVCLDKT